MWIVSKYVYKTLNISKVTFYVRIAGYLFTVKIVIIFECNQILQSNLQDMWPESSSVNTVNWQKNLLQFQRYWIFPRGLLFCMPCKWVHEQNAEHCLFNLSWTCQKILNDKSPTNTTNNTRLFWETLISVQYTYTICTVRQTDTHIYIRLCCIGYLWMVRKVHSTNRPWYEQYTVRNVQVQ